MHNSEFEKTVQEKMVALQLAPVDSVWEKVEASLPAERKPRRFLFILLAAALLLFLFFAWNLFYKNGHTVKNSRDNTVASKKITGTDNNTGAAVSKQQTTSDNISVQSNTGGSIDGSVTAVNAIHKTAKASRTSVKMKNAVAEEADAANPAQKEKYANAALKVTVKQPEAEEDETTAAAPAQKKPISLTDTGSKKDSTAVTISKKKDSLEIKTAAEKKQPSKKKWITGIEAGAGISSVKSKPANGGPAFSSSVGTPVAPQPSASAQSSKPSAAFAWGAGLYVQKELNARFTFHTGLRYQYLATSMKVGKYIDSSIRLGFNTTAVLAAGNYYLAGNSTVYKNKFHLLELPLLLQYKPSAASAVYFEGGPSVSWLLHSNALVYSNSTYITSNDAYNKLLFSFNAGAGMKLPLRKTAGMEAGIRTAYMFSTATKPAYGVQHPFSAKLYLRVPFKK